MTLSTDFNQISRTGLTGGNVCSVIEGVRRHAAARPTAEAIRHRRGDVWTSWSWARLSESADALMRAPHMRGVGARTCVFLCGDYTPNLLLFALAAEGLGARIAALPIAATATEITTLLGPDDQALVFLGRREPVEIWTRLRAETNGRVQIIADYHLPWGEVAGNGIVSSAELLIPSNTPAKLVEKALDIIWVEETTDWANGLDFQLQACASGCAYAFPETAAAAHRDRRVVQPTAFALSGRHLSRLSRDFAARLPVGSAFAATMVARAMESAREGRPNLLERLMLSRVRQPFGLQRLRTLTVLGPADGDPDPISFFLGLGIICGGTEPGAAAVSHRVYS